MAYASKGARVTFTADEIGKMCARNDNDHESDIDSDTSGISSNEKCDFDEESEKKRSLKANLR